MVRDTLYLFPNFTRSRNWFQNRSFA